MSAARFGTSTLLLFALAAAGVAGVTGVELARAADETPTTQQEHVDPADAVLDRLLPNNDTTRPSDRGRTLDPGERAGAMDRTSTNAVAPDVRPQRLLREGTFVIDRPGRVRRNDEGDLEFVFRSDGSAAPASAGDPPMVLVPNLNLMAVESAARRDPEQAMRVTGRVTEYRGRNHLLLEKVVLID